MLHLIHHTPTCIILNSIKHKHSRKILLYIFGLFQEAHVLSWAAQVKQAAVPIMVFVSSQNKAVLVMTTGKVKAARSQNAKGILLCVTKEVIIKHLRLN